MYREIVNVVLSSVFLHLFLRGKVIQVDANVKGYPNSVPSSVLVLASFQLLLNPNPF